MLSARLRSYSDAVMLPLGGFFAKSGVSPNIVTILGLLASAAVAWAFAYGNLVYALLLLVLMSFLDVLDGAVANASGKVTKFGGFLDSVADRYSDALILIGIGMYLGGHFVLVMAVIVGSILVSYTRARAENFIEKCDVGLAERAERLIVIMFATLLGVVGIDLFYETLILLAIVTHLTVLQRVLFTKKNIK